MIDRNSLSPERNARRDFVVRVPVRLYKSRDTIFELYDGGRPYQQMVIRWEHLESIEGMDTQPPQFHRRLEEAMNNTEPEVIQRQAQLSPLGRIVATPGALEALKAAQQSPAEFLRRHARGDWGDLSADDVAENEFSLKNGFRLLSSYATASGQKVWVITEEDRSLTILLLPDDY